MIARRLVLDRLRGLRWWALGSALGVAFTVALYPSVRDQEQFEDIVRDLPRGFRGILGQTDIIPITSAPGYFQARLFATLLPILLVVYAISLGGRAIGGAEEDGTLQLVATAPVSRRRIALERLAASTGLVVALAALALAVTLALSLAIDVYDEVPAGRIALATVAITELALLHLGVAFAAGAVTGRRVPTLAAGSVLAVGGFLLHGLAASAEAVEPVRILSPWWWALDRNLLVHDPTFLAVGLPLVIAALAVVAGVLAYERRDLRFP